MRATARLEEWRSSTEPGLQSGSCFFVRLPALTGCRTFFERQTRFRAAKDPMPDTADYTLSDAPWAVLLAAGQGTRLMQAAGMPKQFLRTEGVPLFWLSARAFRLVPRLSGIVFVFPPDRLGECEKMVRELSGRASGPRHPLRRGR